MTFNEYQNEGHTYAVYPENYAIVYTALGLAGEAGEYAGKISKVIRDEAYNSDQLVSELGDVLWFLSESATAAGVTLDEVAACNIAKLRDRKARGVIKGSGDNR